MADLKVDYAALNDVRAALDNIAGELDRSDARRDELQFCWGGNEVRRAMRGFVEDWDRHRRKMIASLREVAGMSAAMVDTFQAIDAALAGPPPEAPP